MTDVNGAGETPEGRRECENAEEYYCEREYLWDEDAAQTVASTKARVDELCEE